MSPYRIICVETEGESRPTRTLDRVAMPGYGSVPATLELSRPSETGAFAGAALCGARRVGGARVPAL